MNTFFQLVALTCASLMIYYVPFFTGRCFREVRHAYKGRAPVDADLIAPIAGLLTGWIVMLACLAKVIDGFVDVGPLDAWMLSLYVLVNAWRLSVGLQEAEGAKK